MKPLPTNIYNDRQYKHLRREWLAADQLFKEVAADMDGTDCVTYAVAHGLRSEAAENLFNYTVSYSEKILQEVC